MVRFNHYLNLELQLRPDGTLNLERMVQSPVDTDIAGAVPSWTSLQVLESKVWVPKNADECPYLVDGLCPNAGTRPGRARSTHAMFQVEVQ
jgi:hypothetical protein